MVNDHMQVNKAEANLVRLVRMKELEASLNLDVRTDLSCQGSNTQSH